MDRRLALKLFVIAAVVCFGFVTLRWVLDRHAHRGGVYETPEAHGAAGDGIKDDTAAVQAALDAVHSAGGGALYLGKIYRTSSTLRYIHKEPIFIFGNGASSSIKSTMDSGDILFIGAPYTLATQQILNSPDTPSVEADGNLGVRLDNFRIFSTVSRTSGYGLHTGWTDSAMVHRIKFGSIDEQHWKLYGGISMEAQSNCDIANCEIYSTMCGIQVNGCHIRPNKMAGGISNIPMFHYDGQIRACVIWGSGTQDDPRAWKPGSYGVWLNGGVGGFRICDNTNVSGYQYGCYVNTFDGAGKFKALERNRELFLDSSYLDSNGDAGLYVADKIERLTINDGWAIANNQDPAHTHGYGIWLAGGVAYGATISGGVFDANEGSDLYLDNPDNTLNCTGASFQKVTLRAGSNVAISGGSIGAGLAIGTVATLRISGVLGFGDTGTQTKRTAVAANYTALPTDSTIAVTDTSSARTITLPAANAVAASASSAFQLTIKDESGGAATHNITVSAVGSDTIDGAKSRTVSTNYGAISLYSNGSGWFTK